jgi:hypothetical protein
LKKQKILNIKPTQFAVGMLEVDQKIALVRDFGKKQLRAFIEETPVPIVISPQGEYYSVDHHHFLCVCYHIGVEKVRVKVVKDLSKSKMSYEDFWKWMFKSKSAYPFCQFGEGPRKALYLPRDIRGLADDPYRSLAWFVRKAGAFKNSDRNFTEFKWANFFRKRRLLDRYGPQGMPQVLVKAAELAQSSAAKNLPGYGKLNLTETAAVKVKAKRKGSELAS